MQLAMHLSMADDPRLANGSPVAQQSGELSFLNLHLPSSSASQNSGPDPGWPIMEEIQPGQEPPSGRTWSVACVCVRDLLPRS